MSYFPSNMFGYKVVLNNLLSMREYRQFRFPKSKKKRIIKKWRKKSENWKVFEFERIVKIDDTIFVGPKAYQHFLELKTA